ncbi:uncharacterized protein LOC106535891 isoform X2 [Austrofundulus limnaeus]|uniref:Uncharacterized protein LOC106535891 isoform X2 n=1 Tax=Austrofundulus limnaeus TaxID=52670 RepID=A0A2I4D8B1_AUSLI|nr:PREDICTED: uncharacterized protein LOC106535891 isoform X2 [Austrofundulus limnaeus]
MEEAAVQQEKMEGSREQVHDGGKADWKNDCSFSNLLKHSCLLCWSSPRDTDVIEMDDRVLSKAAEIRELENAVTVENLELQEQQSDRQELEETLQKLEKHKDKLIQQIKATRQLCYEESQKILSLQAEEAQKENQVEEFERELARARWRLKKLREEVKQAKKKVEEAGERNTPLQDSIRQSYEEILQEENTLCSLSGGVVTPESQLEESTSPADTTEEDPLPLRPWGRSQSLPAYADLIMGGVGLSLCNNLAGTREEDDSGTSSPKDMDRSDIDEDPEDTEIHNTGGKKMEEGSTLNPNLLSQLDFYQDNPFTHCQADDDLFNEDLFTKTDSSDGFASDPFKGSNPFAADILFPDAVADSNDAAGNVGEDEDVSLSCAENKASTGTQCFESEFPEEDSDIEISYSREDLETIDVGPESCSFKPIQSSSEELMPELRHNWKSEGQPSVESDPNGYELDLCPVSPPSDIEEQSVGSLADRTVTEAKEQGVSSCPAEGFHQHSEHSELELDWTDDINQTLPCDSSCNKTEEVCNVIQNPQNPAPPQNSLDSQNLAQPDLEQNDFELNYEPSCQPSFDPYGFKLSPEHSQHSFLDPDEADLSPKSIENIMSFDPEASSSPPHELNFDPYGFEITASQMVRDSDPYGFKLSPEEENQEVLDLCDHGDLEVMGLCTYEDNEQMENFDFANQEILKPHTYENQEVFQPCDQNFPTLPYSGNQEVTEPCHCENNELDADKNQELADFSGHENQEVLEPCSSTSHEEFLELCSHDNQEVLETCDHVNQELLAFSHPENQEVPDLDQYENQELLSYDNKENLDLLASDNHEYKEVQELSINENQQLLDLDTHENQEDLDLTNTENPLEGNNNQSPVEAEADLSSSNNSSDSDLGSENLLGLEPSNTNICSATTDRLHKTISNVSAAQSVFNPANSHSLLEGDLGSVFGAGGYIGCPDVADDLEPLGRRQENPQPEPTPPVRPVRPPRPSLRAKEKKAPPEGIDLK